MGGLQRELSSCLWLEKSTAWRNGTLVLLIALLTAPTWPLAWRLVVADSFPQLGIAYWTALGNSFELFAFVAVASFLIGLPSGLFAALYDFPARRLLLVTLTVPALVPSFLWAIGWSSLAQMMGPQVVGIVNGPIGCCLVFLASAVPIVLWIAFAATSSLTGTQIEAARLAGGEQTVVYFSGRAIAVSCLLAAFLAGVLSMADPGPGQIFGQRTAASEVFISFASLYDYRLAAWQCVVLLTAILLVAAPIAFLTSRRISAQILCRQVRPPMRIAPSAYTPALCGLFVILAFLFLIAPMIGLLLPLQHSWNFSRAWNEVQRTGLNTLTYGIGSGALATVVGFSIAILAGRNSRMRAAAVGICVVLLAMPPSIAALGLLQIGSSFPAWLDWLARSKLTVCLALGIRFFPIAVILGLRSWGNMPCNWTYAAALHGVSTVTFLAKVAVPHMFPALIGSILLTGLLATADVGTILLLHSPGEASFPLAIFTVMANAPESLVASLCLLYVALAIGIVSLFWRKIGSKL